MNPKAEKFSLPNSLSQREAMCVSRRESTVSVGSRLIYWAEEPGYRLRAVVEICDLGGINEKKFGAQILAYLHKGFTDRSWQDDYITVEADNLYFPCQPITNQDISDLQESRAKELDLRRESFLRSGHRKK